jgi:hypothetical protein
MDAGLAKAAAMELAILFIDKLSKGDTWFGSMLALTAVADEVT